MWTPETLNNLTFTVSDLTSGSESISKDDIRTSFVRYVMTDELNKDGLGACGYRNSADFDSTLVADVLDHLTPSLVIPANSAQGGWISVRVPQHAEAGKYTGTVTVRNGDTALSELKLTEPHPSCSFRMGFPSGPMAESLCCGALLWCGTIQ